MNMAELIALKNALSKKIKYGAIKPDDEIKTLPRFETVEEISAKGQTVLAKDNIEKILEGMVEYLGTCGINYDLIFLRLEVKCFIKEYAIREYQALEYNLEYNTSDGLENKFNPNDILDDYISFTYEFDIFECMKNGDYNIPASRGVMAKIESKFKSRKRFVVKYNQFIAMINELGYSVVLDDTDEESPSFEKIKSIIANRESIDLVIGLDFRKKERTAVSGR